MNRLFTLLLVWRPLFLNAQERWGEWESWGQVSDSTYRNPIIPSDYSDIDCIRVGETYYAISSTFQFSPATEATPPG